MGLLVGALGESGLRQILTPGSSDHSRLGACMRCSSSMAATFNSPDYSSTCGIWFLLGTSSDDCPCGAFTLAHSSGLAGMSFALHDSSSFALYDSPFAVRVADPSGCDCLPLSIGVGAFSVAAVSVRDSTDNWLASCNSVSLCFY